MRLVRMLGTCAGLAAVALVSIPGVSARQAPAPKPATPVQRPAPPVAVPPAARPIDVPTLREEQAPSATDLGVAVYPSAQFIRSYDAGRGQRFYVFGTQATFIEIVNYYRNLLRTKGESVFERPATFFFETGKFREEAMAVSPGVTIKDFTATGSAGYPNPHPGATPAAFPTVIQIVPATPVR